MIHVFPSLEKTAASLSGNITMVTMQIIEITAVKIQDILKNENVRFTFPAPKL